MKDIAASRIDNGPGSKLQGAVLDEMKLTLTTPHVSLYSDADLLGSFDHSLLQHNPVLGCTRGSQRAQAEASDRARRAMRMAWRRFIFAIFGGLAIVVPAMVIAVDKAPPKTLAVVSVSIFTFSLAVAVFSTVSPEYLLGATAAYSAVLMVFMGNCDQG